MDSLRIDDYFGCYCLSHKATSQAGVSVTPCLRLSCPLSRDVMVPEKSLPHPGYFCIRVAAC